MNLPYKGLVQKDFFMVEDFYLKHFQYGQHKET
jgi:hypothetical protein